MIPKHLFVQQHFLDLNNCGPAITASVINYKKNARVAEIEDLRDGDEDTKWWTAFDIMKALRNFNVSYRQGSVSEAAPMLVLTRRFLFIKHWVYVEPKDRGFMLTDPYYVTPQFVTREQLRSKAAITTTLVLL